MRPRDRPAQAALLVRLDATRIPFGGNVAVEGAGLAAEGGDDLAAARGGRRRRRFPAAPCAKYQYKGPEQRRADEDTDQARTPRDQFSAPAVKFLAAITIRADFNISVCNSHANL